MKTVSQISSERYMLLALLKEWVIFGSNAKYAPPKKYYDSLNQLTKKSQNAIVFCATEQTTTPTPPPEMVGRSKITRFGKKEPTYDRG